MPPSFRQRLFVAAALAFGVVLADVPAAFAQYHPGGGFFIFRDPFRQPPRRVAPRAPLYPRESLPQRQQAAPEPEGGTIYGSTEAADKNRSTPAEDYVLVIGDSLADQLAQGLADAFHEERPEIAVIKKTRGSSGLVRADFFDWPTELAGQLEGEKPSAIVMMLGSNDRQTLRDEKGAHEIRSDRWRELYVQRVDTMINALKSYGVPVIVVGAPAMRHARLNADMPYINEILRERATAAGVLYVDVWDGFVNEQDEFITMGPALDGQTRRLRMGDGVHFTRVGARKLAHYVERDLIRLFDHGGAQPTIPLTAPEAAPTTPATPAPGAPADRPIAGPILPLNQPIGPVQGLAGANRPSAPNGGGEAQRVLVEGEPLRPVSGRADDFRWPRSEVKIAPAPAPPTGKPATAAVPDNAAKGGAAGKGSAKGPNVIAPQAKGGAQVITVPEGRGR
jgi:hypothetical protein